MLDLQRPIPWLNYPKSENRFQAFSGILVSFLVVKYPIRKELKILPFSLLTRKTSMRARCQIANGWN